MAPTLVALKYSCYDCEKRLREARNLRDHLLASHQLQVPTRPRGGKNPISSDKYVYVQKIDDVPYDGLEEHYGCPSCVSHFPQLDELKRHVQSEHLKPTTRANTRRAHNAVNIPEKRQGEAIGIETRKRQLYTFSLSSYSYEPNMPKFPQKIIDKLQPIVSINESPVPHDTPLQTLSTSFPQVHSLLLTALGKDIDTLPCWLWSSKNVGDLEPCAAKLWNVARFNLMNFIDNCAAPNIMSTRDYERTWWVRRVVPIFQTFGNQTGLLGFDWCECETKHHALAEMNCSLWEKGKPRFADGLGYDKNGDERLIMEGSSGQYHENVQKTVDDSIKQVNSMISMLKSLASSHMNASVTTLAATRVFGLQAIRTTIVLSEVQIDLEGKYHYNEMRTAVIPTTYDQRNKWLKVMELLAYLLNGLEDQMVNIKALDDEQCGYVNVSPSDMIGNTIL